MKKLYLVGGLAALTLTINAQNTNRSSYSVVPAQLESCSKSMISAGGQAYAKEQGVVFWSEDFTGGLPVGWATVDNNGLGYDWVLSNAANITANYTNTTAIASTSGGNYMLLFGDDYNSTSFTAMDSYFQTSSINLGSLSGGTGFPEVTIRWQQKFRHCCSSAPLSFTVQVSRDSMFTPGPTTVSYEANPGVAVNAMSSDPETTAVNISDVAGGNYTGDIFIRFHKTTNTHYFWMIDDIELLETPYNEIVMLDGFWANTTGSTVPYIPYSMIPQSQLNDIDFYGVIFNNGQKDQPNTVMTATVSGAASGSYGNVPYTFSAHTTDTVMTGPMVGAGAANGSYSVAWSVASDSTDFTPVDNAIADGRWDFEINNSVYARDAGAGEGSYSTRDFDNDGLVDPVEFFLDYQFYNADTVMSIAAVFPGGPDENQPGQELYYNIYDQAGNPVYDGVTATIPTYTLTSGDLTPSGAGSEIWVNLPLTDPLTGNAGYPIDPALGEIWTVSIGNEFDSLFVEYSGEAMAVGGSWTTAGVTWYPITPSPSGDAYYTTDCFMMRLNLATASTGLNEDEIGANLGQNIPNPFNGSTMVPFTLSNSANVEFVVMDVTGKIVEKQGLGKLQAGQHNVTFASNDLAGGIYYYSVIVDGIRTTKKMAVAK